MIDSGPTVILFGEAEEDGWTYGYEMLAVPLLPESISSLIYQPSVSVNCVIEAYGKHWPKTQSGLLKVWELLTLMSVWSVVQSCSFNS